MADHSSLGTVELLTRAADAAGKAAAEAEPRQGDEYNDLEWRELEDYCGSANPGQGRLIAASGPDHWRAVEALLRGLLSIHQADHPGDDCVLCWESGWQCSTLEALRPLAGQVLRDLEAP